MNTIGGDMTEDKDVKYRSKKRDLGLVQVQLFLKDEYVTAIDMEVERRQKNGDKTNRSLVANEWIWEAMESLEVAHGIGVKT